MRPALPALSCATVSATQVFASCWDVLGPPQTNVGGSRHAETIVGGEAQGAESRLLLRKVACDALLLRSVWRLTIHPQIAKLTVLVGEGQELAVPR